MNQNSQKTKSELLKEDSFAFIKKVYSLPTASKNILAKSFGKPITKADMPTLCEFYKTWTGEQNEYPGWTKKEAACFFTATAICYYSKTYLKNKINAEDAENKEYMRLEDILHEIYYNPAYQNMDTHFNKLFNCSLTPVGRLEKELATIMKMHSNQVFVNTDWTKLICDLIWWDGGISTRSYPAKRNWAKAIFMNYKSAKTTKNEGE